MKTAKERAFELVDQIMDNFAIHESFEDDLVRKIELALKEQDKITRHACAGNLITDKEFSRWSEEERSWKIRKDDAHSLIMNTRAV